MSTFVWWHLESFQTVSPQDLPLKTPSPSSRSRDFKGADRGGERSRQTLKRLKFWLTNGSEQGLRINLNPTRKKCRKGPYTCFEIKQTCVKLDRKSKIPEKKYDIMKLRYRNFLICSLCISYFFHVYIYRKILQKRRLVSPSLVYFIFIEWMQFKGFVSKT